jgi:hypothetical protein
MFSSDCFQTAQAENATCHGWVSNPPPPPLPPLKQYSTAHGQTFNCLTFSKPSLCTCLDVSVFPWQKQLFKNKIFHYLFASPKAIFVDRTTWKKVKRTFVLRPFIEKWMKIEIVSMFREYLFVMLSLRLIVCPHRASYEISPTRTPI